MEKGGVVSDVGDVDELTMEEMCVDG